MITICNYDTYQSNYKTEGQAEGQTKGEQMNMQLSDIHPMQGGSLPPAIQVEVKEEEEEKEE